jgi:hypothetical protein
MMDLVTVVFLDELPILKSQAQSVELYCQHMDLGDIVVIVNDDDITVSDIDPAWWGTLQDRVKIVHRRSWSVDYATNGWLTQQLLKLLACASGSNAWSMVVDAKTIFVNPVLQYQTRPQVSLLDIQSVFDISRQRVNQLFGIDLQKQLGPGGVPFVMNNQMTRDMIKEVESRTGQNFAAWFQAQGMVTEFILYSGYVLFAHGSFDLMYRIGNLVVVPCNLCHSEVADFDRKFAFMPQATTVSIHRRAWQQLSDQQRDQYRDFLAQRGIACEA